MKSRTEYVRAPFVAEIQQQIRDYKRFKKLVARWIDLGIEYSRLSMKDRIDERMVHGKANPNSGACAGREEPEWGASRVHRNTASPSQTG